MTYGVKKTPPPPLRPGAGVDTSTALGYNRRVVQPPRRAATASATTWGWGDRQRPAAIRYGARHGTIFASRQAHPPGARIVLVRARRKQTPCQQTDRRRHPLRRIRRATGRGADRARGPIRVASLLRSVTTRTHRQWAGRSGQHTKQKARSGAASVRFLLS